MVENLSTHSDLEVFTRELNFDCRSTVNKLYCPTFFGLFGFGLAVAANYLQRKPVFSGIQRHIAFVALGVPAGLYADKKLQERYVKKDAKSIYYIKSHPDDFPVVDRIKYKDVLLPWHPRR